MVVIYARVGTWKGDLDQQLNDLRKFAAENGWHICYEYVDQGASGASHKRLGFDRMMDDCRKGKVDAVLVWSVDRLSRVPNHLDVFKSLGIALISYKKDQKQSERIAVS